VKFKFEFLAFAPGTATFAWSAPPDTCVGKTREDGGFDVKPAGVIWQSGSDYYSDTTTFETTGISSSSSSSANDFAASLTYAVAGNWLLDAGYRVTWVNSGRHDLGGTVWNTTVQWQGAVLTVGARF